jgi:hypothetical protein
MGACPESIAGGEHYGHVLLLKTVGDLRYRGRLACSVYSDEHYDGGPLPGLHPCVEVELVYFEDTVNSIPDRHLDYLVKAVFAAVFFTCEIFTDAVLYLLCHRKGDVGFEQDDLQLVEDGFQLLVFDPLAGVPHRGRGRFTLFLLRLDPVAAGNFGRFLRADLLRLGRNLGLGF